MKKSLSIALVLLLSAGMLFANGDSDSTSTADEVVGGFNRSETVFVTGGMWASPSSANFNPITWSVPAGIRGLTYEPLQMYDPLTDSMVPWLAQSIVWSDDSTMVITLREGTTWSDGTPLTSEDVAFTFEYPAWSNPFLGFLESVTIVDEKTVEVTFNDPAYHSINLQSYIWPVVPKAVFGEISPDEATSYVIPGPDTLGSGPYVVEAVDEDRVVYLRDDDWWGIEAMDISFPAKRVVYIKSMANNVAMAMLQQGRELDMANNFVSGLPAFKRNNDNLHTYFEGSPHHMQDNVVYLMPNHTRKPFDDAQFRRAMAFAINPEEIVDIAYEGTVTAPNNSLGLLDNEAWAPYNNEDIAQQYGFKFDPSEAEAILDAAGYVDADGDGWRDLPDGSELRFNISVPYGYTDWMDALRVIVDNLNAVGLNAVQEFPDESRYQTEMVQGNFDVLINNWGSYQSSSPYTIYQWLFSTYTEVGSDEWTGNFGRYDNAELRDLVAEFARVPMDDTDAGNEIIRQIQMIHMEEMPYIPLWTNGMWFMANDSVWTNWPGENTTNQNYPSLWTDKLQIGGLLMLSEIELAQ